MFYFGRHIILICVVHIKSKETELSQKESNEQVSLFKMEYNIFNEIIIFL